METSNLLYSFNDDQVDNILAGMVGIFEKVFPDRIRAYYVIGSYVDGTQLPTSDIDGYILFKDNLSPEDFMKTIELGGECSQLSPIPLDFAPRPEKSLRRHGVVDLKLASCIIYGEDIRDELELLDVSFYTYFMMDEGLQRIAAVRNNPPYLTYPVDYPDPDGAFYGYDQPGIPDAQGNAQQSTKALVHVVGKPATAIVLLNTQQHVKNKRDSVQRYQSEIADQWASLVGDVYEKCRNQWHYRIPQAAADRQMLHAICQRALEFENRFLRLLRDFLLDGLRNTEAVSGWMSLMELPMLMGVSPAELQPLMAEGLLKTTIAEGEQQVLIEAYDKHLVTGMLEKVVFPGDNELVDALRQMAIGDNPLLQQAVERALGVQERALTR